MAANQVDFKILPSDQFSVYSPATRSDKVITYFTLLSKLRGDILSVGQDDDPNNIVSAFYSSVGGTQTLHLVKADGSEITASQPEQIISGTVNFVSKFTTANDIGDSQIFDNGTNVGIGTTSMTHKLQLATGGVFADYYQLDTTYTNGFVVGAISWDIDNGTADIGLSSTLKLKIGQDDTWYVKNQSGSTITKGTVVYASGTLGASGRITIAPMIANGTIPSRFLLGIVAENILNGADGYVIAKGKIRQINTNAFNDGDVLWVSPTVAGALTVTEPTAPNLKLAVAFVVHKATNGILAVRTTTGVRIADASDVEYAGAADNSFLIYNSATGVWEDEAVGIFKTIAVAGQSSVVADTYDDTLTLVAGTNITITTDATTDSITINSTDQFVGTVTSVNMSVPTGFAISGNPITTSGTLAVAFDTGYSLPTNASQATWNTAYNDSITAFAYNTSTAVLTLTQQDAGTLTATVTLQPFSTSNLAEGTNLYYTDTRARLALSAGTGITYDSATGVITNSAPDLTVVLTASTGISVTGTYPSFTIANTAPDQTVVLTGGTGITTSGTYPSFTVTNSDRGSSQNIFKNIAVAGQSTIVADVNDDTLTVVAGSGVTITTNDTTDTITISATGSGGTVTSVDLTAGTGISVSGGPITSSGSITVNNTAPDQTVVLTASTGITTSGTYPNFTIANSAPDQTVVLTGGTGITTSGTYPSFTVTNSAPDQTVVLTAGTGITTSGTYPSFTVTNSAPDQTVALTAGTGISISGTYPSFTITNTSAGGGTITGSGTTNYVSKFTSASAIGDSIVYDSGTKVGISTTGPTAKLEILNTPSSLPTLGTASGNLALTDNGLWGMYFGLEGSSGKGWIQQMRNDSITSYPLLIQPVGGNVGIGTTAPGQKLQVDGSLLVNTGTSATAFRDIMMGGIGGWSSGESHGIDTVYNTAASPTTFSRIESHFDGTNGKMRFRNLYNASAPRTDILMTIQGNGNVGIGTDSPTYKFEVSDGTRTGVINPNASLDGIFIGVTQAKPLVFGTTDTERMRLTASGNLGIGNTAPSQILHVTGNIRVTGAYYDSANAAGTSGQILSSTGTGTSWIAAPSGGGISGSGTTNYVPKWTSGSAIGNSAIYDNSGNIGIGITAPSALFHVSGTVSYGSARFSPTLANGESAIAFYSDVAGTVTNTSWVVGQAGWGHTGDFVIGNENGGAGGNVRLLIERSGNIGIENTAPGARLTVGTQSSGSAGSGVAQDNSIVARFGASNTGSRVTGATIANTATATIGNDATLSFIVAGDFSATGLISSILQNTSTAATDMVFSVYNSSMQERMRIAANGNVGIGTTDPTAKLYIEGGSANWNETTPGLSVGTIHLDPGVTTDNFGNAITFGASDTSNGTDAQAGIYVRSDGAYGTKMYFATTDAYVSGSKTRMYISEVGNVGIGTTGPLVALDVRGTTIITNPSGNNYNENLRLPQNSGGYATITLGGAVAASGSDANQWSFLRNPSNSLEIRRQDSVYFLINSSGNVGIGTTAPGYKFTVAGSGNSWNVNPHAGGIDLYSTGNIAPHYQTSFDWYTGAPGGGTFRMGLTSGGNLGIGAAASYRLDVSGDARITSGSLGVGVAPNATDGRIDASNDIVAFSSSDLRLKENIKPIENALEKVKSLTGVEFDWKPELKHAHGYEGHDTGVIAQEVQEVMPTAIRTNDTGYLAVRYEKLIGLLIEANKELAARVEELESKFK